MEKKFRKSLFIFRRDLRLEDNTGLIFALQSSDVVIPAFIFTPSKSRKTPYSLQRDKKLAQACKTAGIPFHSFDDALLKDYFEKKAPPGTKVVVHLHGEGGEVARSNPSSKGVQAFAHAYSEVFGTPCKYILEGASIPIIPKLAKYSGGEPILVGLGLATDNIHAPNEHFSLDRLEKGAQMIVKAIERLGS